ncbi:MAG TPA: sulfotransferase family 2 domain-containing protein [Xanthomonadales bacterium]|nr:sulfotransferase family 2 domain-containing protein [Xanthomonadales bacterium]
MICREFNCLFVHIPKTAGQSLEQFFMHQLGLDWDADRDRVLLGDNKDPTRGTEKLAHLSAAEYVDCAYVSREEFATLFKFSFVRNPFDRIVSEYRYRNYFHHRSFRHFVLHELPRPGWDDRYRHIMPQFDMLHDSDGRLLVDFVGKFETLQTDFDRVCARLGISSSPLPHRNPSDKTSRKMKRWLRNFVYRNGESGKRDYTEYFDQETLAAVSRLYRRDLQVFGYRFGAGQMDLGNPIQEHQ